jgi:Family of unknown function (DUF6519)/FHA domain
VYGDFSRLPGGLSGPYSGVLAQQGRLLLDSELNEQNAILLDYLRCLTADLIGPFAGPVHSPGFSVDLVFDDDNKCHAVRLGPGHYYVYGLRCQAPAPHQYPDEELPVGKHEVPFVVYLMVWEQSVSAIQVPELIDPALSANVPDTSRRSQVRWRPVVSRSLPTRKEDLTALDRGTIIRAFEEFNADPHHRPTLGARAHSGNEPEPGPATAPTPWGYRGVENQLYRVEIHRGGDLDAATFKWSRENGSVEFGVEDLGVLDGGARTATLQRVWRDARQGLEVGDWVEFVDDHWAPFGAPPALMQVQAPVTFATRQVTLHDPDSGRAFDAALHPLLRRWDQRPEDRAADHGIPVKHAHQRWFELEDGVHVRFESESARYERGDFWLIPARTATSGVLWPRSHDGAPLAIPPHGPPRYVAPLALQEEDQQLVDLRVQFGYRMPEPNTSSEPSRPPMPRQDAPTTAIRQATVHYLLRSLSKRDQGAVYRVEDGTIIGREPGASIHIDDPDVSRHHVEFRLTASGLTVTDLGSTNGTEVNGRALTAREPVTLTPGAVIQVGPSDLQFRVETG